MTPTQVTRVYKLQRDVQHDGMPALLFKMHASVVEIETMCDITLNMPPVYDQGSIGSCTANALAAAYQYDEKRQNKLDWIPSRLFIYFCERERDGTINIDSGAQISTGANVLANIGVISEKMWPYNESAVFSRPTKNCYSIARSNKCKVFRIAPNSLSQIRQALLSGFPVVFGMNVYESFETEEVASTGIVPMPNSTERCLGGHAVLIVGYNDVKKTVHVRNSWGAGWGDHGYFHLPYDYISNKNLTYDFWTIRTGHDIPSHAEHTRLGVIRQMFDHLF